MRRGKAIDLIAALLIMLFVYAGLSRLLDYHAFKTQLSNFLLIKTFAGHLAWALPVAELILSALLLWPHTRLWGFYSSFLLLMIFSVYIIYMLLAVDNIPCACGAVFRFMSWTGQLTLNILFLLLALLGIGLQIRARTCQHTHTSS